VALRRGPKRIFVDNGSEFSGRHLDLWACHHGVRIDSSRPGKPTDNGFVETIDEMALVAVCDTGHGMEGQELTRIFDPFRPRAGATTRITRRRVAAVRRRGAGRAAPPCL